MIVGSALIEIIEDSTDKKILPILTRSFVFGLRNSIDKAVK